MEMYFDKITKLFQAVAAPETEYFVKVNFWKLSFILF